MGAASFRGSQIISWEVCTHFVRGQQESPLRPRDHFISTAAAWSRALPARIVCIRSNTNQNVTKHVFLSSFSPRRPSRATRDRSFLCDSLRGPLSSPGGSEEAGPKTHPPPPSNILYWPTGPGPQRTSSALIRISRSALRLREPHAAPDILICGYGNGFGGLKPLRWAQHRSGRLD